MVTPYYGYGYELEIRLMFNHMIGPMIKRMMRLMMRP